MRSDELKSKIFADATLLAQLHARIHQASKKRDESIEKREEWRLACEEFHARYDSLSFPGGYEGALERIVAGDKATVEAAICFLEVRPYFFRSGYMYKDILRKCKHAPMSADQAERFAAILEKLTEWKTQKVVKKS